MATASVREIAVYRAILGLVSEGAFNTAPPTLPYLRTRLGPEYESGLSKVLVGVIWARLVKTFFIEMSAFNRLLDLNNGAALSLLQGATMRGPPSMRQVNTWYHVVLLANVGRTVAEIGICLLNIRGRQVVVAPPPHLLRPLAEADFMHFSGQSL